MKFYARLRLFFPCNFVLYRGGKNAALPDMGRAMCADELRNNDEERLPEE